MKKKKSILLLILLPILLLACNHGELLTEKTIVPPEPTATDLPPTATPTPTQELVVTQDSNNDFSLDDFPLSQLSIGDPYSPELGNLGYNIKEYHLVFNIDPAFPNQFENQATIKAVSDYPSLEYISFDFTGYDIHNVEVNDSDVKFLRTQYKLLIKLNEPIAKNEEFDIFVHYSGKPDDSPTPYSLIKFSQGPIFPTERTMIVISEPDGARKLFPCNDHPRDKAIFTVDIITPSDLIGVSNGNLYDTQLLDTDEIKYRWKSNDKMATYLLTVAVGDYEIEEYTFDNGLIVRNYVLPGTEYYLKEYMPILNEAMTIYEEYFGPYPFETFGHVLHFMDGITLESQATVALSSTMIDENTLLHELVHMWFGNWVSLDSWGEIWRNEGFATYFGKLYLNRDTPNTYGYYMEAIYVDAINRDDLFSLGDLPKNEMFGYESYVVGSAVVYRLREELGDDAFFNGLKNYLNIYGGGTASDAEFQAVMEDACQCSLDEFFSFWLEP
jgi:aminopeptidase N